MATAKEETLTVDQCTAIEANVDGVLTRAVLARRSDGLYHCVMAFCGTKERRNKYTIGKLREQVTEEIIDDELFPFVAGTIMTPEKFQLQVESICQKFGGEVVSMEAA